MRIVSLRGAARREIIPRYYRSEKFILRESHEENSLYTYFPREESPKDMATLRYNRRTAVGKDYGTIISIFFFLCFRSIPYRFRTGFLNKDKGDRGRAAGSNAVAIKI